jgi:GNAT superfamily N-acetyltransferase
MIAQNSTQAYWLSPMNRYLAPRAPEHPDDLPRMFRQVTRRRLVGGDSMMFVACLASDMDRPVGHIAFMRQGNDAGAKEFKRSVASNPLFRLWLYILTWIFWAYDKVDELIKKPRAFDPAAIKQLKEWGKADGAKYWTSHPERTNKWYVDSLVIHPDYQGKGIGKLLMEIVLQEAQSERALVGLMSSRHGAFLYRKLGFELLGDFGHRPPTEGPGDKGGGYMLWYPEGYEGNRNNS